MATQTAANTDSRQSKATFESIRQLVSQDMVDVDALVAERLSSKIQTVLQISKHIVSAGGKRLRPLLVLLAARACDYSGNAHIKLATLVEFLHTATLLHDDVVDDSAKRRGRASANSIWGNAASILVGDLLYSRAFELMVEIDRLDVLAIMSEATNGIVEGEVMQLENVSNVELTRQDYLKIIRRKSALLFEASAHTSAVLSDAPKSITDAMRVFGLNFGLAFQIIDDILDYSGDSDALGKNIGADLAEGKVTLPLLLARDQCSDVERDLIQRSITDPANANLPKIITIVRRNGGIEFARDVAQGFTEKAQHALQSVPANVYRHALQSVTTFALQRIQ